MQYLILIKKAAMVLHIRRFDAGMIFPWTWTWTYSVDVDVHVHVNDHDHVPEMVLAGRLRNT